VAAEKRGVTPRESAHPMDGKRAPASGSETVSATRSGEVWCAKCGRSTREWRLSGACVPIAAGALVPEWAAKGAVRPLCEINRIAEPGKRRQRSGRPRSR
jgi:hypothetical protein